MKEGKRPVNANGEFSGHPATVENGPSKKAHFRKILVSVKIVVRNSGAGHGCANSNYFMGAWKNALFLQEKTMSVKFLRGGGYFGFWGGGECRFYFYGREDFSDH